ncbi:MAG: copper homeostasis protein CutC [Schleiferiaceae bacterium]
MADRIEIEIALEEARHAEGLHALGVDRIELCENLAEGGLTPSFGRAREVVASTPLPVYAMLRPRAGNFHYSSSEQHQMLLDLEMLSRTGIRGIVVGALTEEGMLDERFITLVTAKAKQHNLGITFHRAFDVCKDPEAVVQTLIDLGVERILTSGFQPKVDSQGLAKVIKWAGGRIQIQAGSGVHAEVVPYLKEVGTKAYHCTARKWSASEDDSFGFEGEWKRDEDKIKALVAAARA